MNELISTDKVLHNDLKVRLKNLINKGYADDISTEQQALVTNFNTSSKLGVLEQNKNSFNLNNHEVKSCLVLEDKDVFPYLMHRYRYNCEAQNNIVGDYPIHLLIEPVSYCNIRCTMCFQVDPGFSKEKEFIGKMDLDLFKKCIDNARENSCRAITLASRGEPTLHPQFKEFIEYAGADNEHQFYEFKINTNATKLTEELCHVICKNNVNLLVFSVDSDNKEQYERIRVGGKFEQVFNNIKRFSQIKNKFYPNVNIFTRISGVLVEGQDINVIRDFWKPYVDEVSLINELPRWDTYNNKINKKKSPCPVLNERMYVWFDGTCNPCDFDYKSHLKVGHVNDQSINAIWKSDAFTKLRESHKCGDRGKHMPCDRCPL